MIAEMLGLGGFRGRYPRSVGLRRGGQKDSYKTRDKMDDTIGVFRSDMDIGRKINCFFSNPFCRRTAIIADRRIIYALRGDRRSVPIAEIDPSFRFCTDSAARGVWIVYGARRERSTRGSGNRQAFPRRAPYTSSQARYDVFERSSFYLTMK